MTDMTPKIPEDRIVQIAATSDRIICLMSSGRMFIANKATSIGWREIPPPDTTTAAPIDYHGN